MKSKILKLSLLTCMLLLSCASSHHSATRRNELEAKVNAGIAQARTRGELSGAQWDKMLREKGDVNEYSEGLIENLLNNGYIEEDVNKVVGIEIDYVLVSELFHLKPIPVIGDTTMITTCIGNEIYHLNFLDREGYEDYPNIYTEIYVYDSARKNIRYFYKVNYDLEYYKIYTDGTNDYKVFY